MDELREQVSEKTVSVRGRSRRRAHRARRANLRDIIPVFTCLYLLSPFYLKKVPPDHVTKHARGTRSIGPRLRHPRELSLSPRRARRARRRTILGSALSSVGQSADRVINFAPFNSWFRVKFAGPRASATASRATPTCQPRRGWPASSAGKHVSPWWRRAPRPPPRGRPPRCSRRVARCRPSSARPPVCFRAPIAGSPRRVWPVPRPRPPRAASPARPPRRPRGGRAAVRRPPWSLRPRW